MYTHICLHVNICTHMHIYMYLYIYVYVHILICIYIYLQIHIYHILYLYIHKYSYMYELQILLKVLHLWNQLKWKIVTFLHKFKSDVFLEFEFVLRDTEESEYLDLADFGGVAFSVDWSYTYIHTYIHMYIQTSLQIKFIICIYMYMYMYVYTYYNIHIRKLTLHMIISVKFEKSHGFYTYLRICEQSWLQRIACRWRNNVWLPWNLWVSLSFVTFKYIPTHPLTRTPTYTRLHFVFFTHTYLRMLIQYKFNHYYMFSIAFVPRDNKASRFHFVLDACFNFSGICCMQTCTHAHNTKTSWQRCAHPHYSNTKNAMMYAYTYMQKIYIHKRVSVYTGSGNIE